MSAALVLPEPTTDVDLFAIPAHERWHEVLDGDLVQRATPSGEHGLGQGSTRARLDPFQRRPGGRQPGGWWILTETEVRFDRHNVLRPDLSGWRRERSPEPPRGFPIDLRPDWVCEVVSPENARRDRYDKMRIYHRFGVPHYWLVDPYAETLVVHRYTPEGWLLVLTARRGETVRPEPFDALPFPVGVLFGDDPDDDAPAAAG